MATAATLIDGALQNLGQIEGGSTANAQEYTDGLAILNRLLGTLNNEIGMCYALREETLTFTASVSRTIGPTGNLVTARPVEIVMAWVVLNNVSIPVQIITDEEYGAIHDKTTTGDYPRRLNYKPTVANGTVYFWPVPNTTGTMKLLTRTPLTAFATTADTVTLPDGWEEMLIFNLAVRWAPQFPGSLTSEVAGIAKETKATLRRMNKQPVKAYTELAHLFGRQHANILTGP